MPLAGFASTEKLLDELGLNTVCTNAKCPNIYECYNASTATFMILGNICTRNCRFCAVTSGTPLPIDEDEPERVAEAASRLKLKHVVITSVTRDDLPDGGASHFANTIKAVRGNIPPTVEFSHSPSSSTNPIVSENFNHNKNKCTIEVLTPDFLGNIDSLKIVMDEKPDVFNHNVETVPRLYKEVRPEAHWERSLGILESAGKLGSAVIKSGLMLGLGETDAEIEDALQALLASGVSAVTIGQYLQPTALSLPVEKYYTPDEFQSWHEYAKQMGFRFVSASPLTRSSYKAGEMNQRVNE